MCSEYGWAATEPPPPAATPPVVDSAQRSGPLFSATRYARTVRHLRPRQIAGQVLRRLQRVGAGAMRGRVREPSPPIAWPARVTFPVPVSDRANDRAAVLSGALTFHNRSEPLGFPPDWNRTDLPLPWCYRLHAHEFLWLLPFERAREAAWDWIVCHPRAPGQIGWEPYPTSIRIVAWCTYFFGRHRSRTAADRAFGTVLWRSVHEQAQHLLRNLEWHLLGNHLLENAVALAVAGSCFDDAAARAWFRKGVALLGRELPEQILADGGHMERSPMYQCRVLYALLVLRATGVAELRALVAPRLASVVAALAALTHPDGGIALLNDSALGVCPDPGRLAQAAGFGPAGKGVFALADSGYYGARTRTGHYVVCDAGPVGPDYQPGHGHADLLSFELSLRGARVVVDSGVSTYEEGPMRAYCRSTRAHNTVEIEGRDQIELWGAFRVGRRCRPRDVTWKPLDGAFELSARHEGYRVLPGKPTHARTFRWRDEGQLEVRDRIESSRPVRSVARLHFHPDCRLGDPDGETVAVGFPGGRVLLAWSGWQTVVREESFYCPAFGVVRPNPCLAFAAVAAHLRGGIRIVLA